MGKRKAATDGPSPPNKKARTVRLSRVDEQKEKAKGKGPDTTPIAGPSSQKGSEAPDLSLNKSKHDNEKQKQRIPSNKRIQKKSVIRKLAPPRPFPVVPTSASATGPKSARHEGKNCICITRKTSLGAYLRMCKRVVMEDGYKTLHLSALGAAIPLLATLVVSLPAIFPYPEDEIDIAVSTGTVGLVDEVIPEDEDQDITTNTREKSSMNVTVRIGNDPETRPERKSVTTIKRGKRWKTKAKLNQSSTTAQVVVQEQEQTIDT